MTQSTSSAPKVCESSERLPPITYLRWRQSDVSTLRLACLIAAASFSGVFCSDLFCRSTAFRNAAGRLSGHGRLIAITDGKGVYEKDLADEDFLTPPDLVAMGNLGRLARKE